MLPSGPCSLEPQERDGQCQSLRDGRGVSHGEEREAGAGAEPSVPRTPLPTHRGDVMTSSAFWAPPLVRGHPWWDQDAAFLLRPPGHRLVSEKVALPRLVAHSRTPQLVPPADSALARRRARRGVRAEASSGVGEVAQAERRTVQGPLLVRSPRRAVVSVDPKLCEMRPTLRHFTSPVRSHSVPTRGSWDAASKAQGLRTRAQKGRGAWGASSAKS